MSKFWKLFMFMHCLYVCVQSGIEDKCDFEMLEGKSISLTFNSEKNEDNVWEDTFSAIAEFSNSSKNMNVNVKHSVFECSGKRIVHITGNTNGDRNGHITSGQLVFHKRTGKNAAIINHGRTAVKISKDEMMYGQVFTNRPLRDNEIFEIKLDEKIVKDSYSLGVGIITVSPDTVNLLPEMWKSPVTWILHHNMVHNNAQGILANYGKDINKLQVGDRVGVMRTEFGALHFFVNGVDQGPGASNIPSPVYGIVELWHNSVKVSIV